MKELKLTKGIQMILGAVLLLIIGIIIVAVVLNNNNVRAAYVDGETCQICLLNGEVADTAGVIHMEVVNGGHLYHCDKCTFQKLVPHSYSYNFGESVHWEECSCGDKKPGSPHVYGTWEERMDGILVRECLTCRTCRNRNNNYRTR